MAIDEEYGFGILNEGQAIAAARNVKVRPNEFVMPARTVFNLSEQGSTYEDVDSVQVNGTGVPVNRVKTWFFSLSVRCHHEVNVNAMRPAALLSG
jgi:hypothetical protein